MPTKEKPTVTCRLATASDIPALVALNRAAYPTMAEDNAVWGAAHLLSHQRVFPDGQFVAVDEQGRI